jgi:hypothetical protein
MWPPPDEGYWVPSTTGTTQELRVKDATTRMRSEANRHECFFITTTWTGLATSFNGVFTLSLSQRLRRMYT